MTFDKSDNSLLQGVTPLVSWDAEGPSYRGDTIRRTQHVTGARIVGACRLHLILLKPGARIINWQRWSRHGLPASSGGETITIYCACGCSLCGSAAGHDGGHRSEACHARVCGSQFPLPRTETQNSGIGAIKGTAGRWRAMREKGGLD